MSTKSRQQAVLETVENLAVELNPRQRPEIGLNTHLEWDLGLGSIERHELLLRLEKCLGESLSSQSVFQANTVGDLLNLTPGSKPGVSREVIEFSTGELPPHPAHVQDLIEALLFQAEHQPTRETIHFLEEGESVCRWTYPDLLAAAQKAAGGLNALGVQSGERLGIMLPTGPEYLATFYGALWIGAVPVPLYPPFRLDQLEDYVKRQASILKVAGVRHLISFEKAKPVMPLLKMQCPNLEKIVSASQLEGNTPPPRAHQRALIQFTSGSTGLPKGVVLTHQALLHNIRGYGQVMNLKDNDVTVSWLPLYHDMGLIGSLLGSVYHGRPLALMGPQDFLARPSRWLWALHKYRGTISPAPNFAYEICARKIPDEEIEGLDLSSWRIALNGAEAVRPETLERFTERYAPYGFKKEAHFPAYGLAEASLAVTFPPPGRGPVLDVVHRETLETTGVVAACGPDDSSLTLVACGRPLPEMEVRVLGEDGEPLPDRRRGFVEFRGPSSLLEYYCNPEATKETKNEDGWVRTGDLGYLSEGDLYLTGRNKDIIIKAGRNIQAEDVEDAVASVEGVRRGCIAAFGVSHDQEGTERLVVVAESRLKDAQDLANLAEAVEKQVTRTIGLSPDVVEITKPHTIPKTPSGKIRRSECKARWQSGSLEHPKGLWIQARNVLTQGLQVYRSRLLELPRKWARKSWCVSWLAGLILAPQVVSLVSREKARALLHPLAGIYLKRVGITLSVRGEADFDRPCILVGNHCSTLDPLVLSAVWKSPVTFLVAPWVAEHPGLKHLIGRLGHLPVHRGDPQAAQKQEAVMLEKLLRGETLAVFPEGGLEITPGLRPFALGAFQLAAKAKVPIIAMALQGTRSAQPWPNQLPYPVPLRATVGEPIWARGEDWESIVALSNSVRDWIADHCGDPISHRRLRRND